MYRICLEERALTPAHMQARLNFARHNLNRDWSRVIFSDERACRTDHRFTGRLKAGIWGFISSAGPGELCFINGHLNTFSYIEMLEEVLLPSVVKTYPNDRMVFMHVR